MRCAGFKPFWPLALAQQAPPAIILAALCRFRGPALFRGLRSSSSQCSPAWLSGLTRQSSGPAKGGPLTFTVSPLQNYLCRPAFIPAFCLSQRFLLWGFGRSPGFACIRCVGFKHFWPPALVQQALVAILLAAPRRFRGSVLFPGPRPS